MKENIKTKIPSMLDLKNKYNTIYSVLFALKEFDNGKDENLVSYETSKKYMIYQVLKNITISVQFGVIIIASIKIIVGDKLSNSNFIYRE